MSGPMSGGEAAAEVDKWVAQARAKAERYQAMQAVVGRIAVTESSKDGMVTVTVDSAGNVTDLRLTDKTRELPGAQVATAVLTTLRRAQAKLPERLGEVMAATIGDDKQTVETVVGNYRAKFPEPEEPEPEPAPQEGVRKIGEIPDEEKPAAAPKPPPPPARPAPPARPKSGDDEDDDGYGQSFMIRE